MSARDELHVFIDASVNSVIACGCYLMIRKKEKEEEILYPIVEVPLTATTSTHAELELALLVLQQCAERGMTLYTDCSNLVTLTTRSYKQTHKHAVLYDHLKALLLEYEVKVVKVKGHRKCSARTHL